MSPDDESLVIVSAPARGVRLVTLDLPNLRNAMTEKMTLAWADAMSELRADPEVRVAVITGAGSSFCSGADLSWLDQGNSQDITPPKLRQKMVPFYDTWLLPRSLPFPVIAAVNGPAIGAGLCLALSCDLRYASRSARFGAPFIHLGTHGGMAVTSLLPEAIGISRAREMLYTGREVSAQEALQWGLVSRVSDDVVQQSLEVADRIASAAPIATVLTKAGLEQSGADIRPSLLWEGLAQPVTMGTSDLHEGIQAKLQHRQPNFDGR
jgi:enoyl-CoA hydratase/carnithine racemase